MSDTHDHRQPPLSSPPPLEPEVADDAGSQALSEALRSSFAIIRVIMVLLVIVFLGSGFFTVGTQEKALLLRLGRPVGGAETSLLGPGPHWAFPYPIDEVVRIPVGQVQVIQSTIGWYATTAAQEAAGNEPPPGPSLNPALDGYVLTADANIIHVRGTLRYRISEPGIRYVFEFAQASNSVQNAFNNALLYASASLPVDRALRDNAEFRERVRRRLEQMIATERMGITVDQIDLLALPPRQVKADFDKVSQALVRRSKDLNGARSYENERLSRAKAEAAVRLNAGETERTRLVEFVAAEANRFSELLPAYRSNPDLFKRQHQVEVLQRLMTNVQDKLVLPEPIDGKPVELRLELNREPPKPKPVEPPNAGDKH
jgi:membrane protease subunit HflK